MGSPTAGPSLHPQATLSFLSVAFCSFWCMSALTYEVKDVRSPVAVWLRATFPAAKEIQAEFRLRAGPQRVVMPAGVAPGTQGAAIDFWLRMLVDPYPSIALPLIGLLSGRAPCVRAGRELLADLAAGDTPRRVAEGGVELRMRPAGFTERGEEWWARVCYALALFVELYRAASVEHSRLMRLTESSGAADLLALATDAEVTDLVAMRDLAVECLLPGLPPGPVTTGVTLDGSADLNADVDLIAGGMLVDFKAGQGGKPPNGRHPRRFVGAYRPRPAPRVHADGLLGPVRPAHRRGVRGEVRPPRDVADCRAGRAHGREPD